MILKLKKKSENYPKQNITVVFTSMNAVNAVRNLYQKKPSWKIFCIGNTTKELVKKFFGEENIKGFADNADQLIKKNY